jgi:hypothetical protein
MTVVGSGWQLEVYEDEDGRQPFTVWAENLSETKFVSLDAALRLVLAERGLDLARTEWLKPLGEGLYEFRVRHDSDEIRQMFAGQGAPPRRRERILLRVFVHFYGGRVILLLGGAMTRARTRASGGSNGRSPTLASTSPSGVGAGDGRTGLVD